MRRLLLVGPILCAGLAVPAIGQAPVVYRIPITGTIEHGLAPYVARSLADARAAGAAAAFLDLDTPGGRVDAAQRIADAVRSAGLPVYAYVDPRAYSAGAMVALATRGIYMRPGAVLGAATPVDGEGKRASEKMVSAMRAEFRALAEQHGLDARIAEAMVDESVGAPGVAEPGRLVTLSTAEALRVGYAKGEVADVPALLNAIGTPGATVVTTEINWAETVVRFLTNPLVSSLLLSLGVLGLVFEIKAGAFGLGGLISLAALGLFFGSSLILGLAGWEEVLLLGIGMIALALELFVLPGFGVAGVLGIVCIGAAVVLAMTGSRPGPADFARAFTVLGASLVITGAVIYAWIRHLPSSGRFSGLLLRGAGQRAEGFVSAPSRPDLVGHRGVALTDLRPSGTARFGDERLDVVTDGEYVGRGTEVEVVRSEGYRHVVRAAPAAARLTQEGSHA